MFFTNLQQAEQYRDAKQGTVITHGRNRKGEKEYEVAPIEPWLQVQIDLGTWERSNQRTSL